MNEGDNNTHFCHRLANSHRRANHISSVEVDGVLYEDESAVHSQVVQFYRELYIETDTWRPTVDGLDFACMGRMIGCSLRGISQKKKSPKFWQRWRGIKPLVQTGLPWHFFINVRRLWRLMLWLYSSIFTGI